MTSALSYSDRIISPRETLERIAGHLPAYGITRLARQTSLDTLGIPVYASFRPNAVTLSTNQGKGLNDDAAKASAAMEALEFAVAERPERNGIVGSARKLAAERRNPFTSVASLPASAEFPWDADLEWLEARDLADGEPRLVPLTVVSLSGVAGVLAGVCQHTNGLASGNSPQEAIFHGLCELVERDAGTLWSLLPTQQRVSRRLAADAFGDSEISRLARLVAQAGLQLSLYDQTSDIGIPTILAEIAQPDGRGAVYDGASGSGTHPVAARACLRAITEAAQSRITVIAGARDDLEPGDYARPRHARTGDVHQSGRAVPPGLPAGMTIEEMTGHIVQRLEDVGIETIIVVPLGGERAGVTVLKVIAEGLEDWGVNSNWRPGQRALLAMAEAIA